MMQRLGITLPAGPTGPDVSGRLPSAALASLAALAALAFGAVLPQNPLATVALVVFVPLVFRAPVATLGILLFVTVLVPFDIQNQLAFTGGPNVPGLLLIDVVLLLALCRQGVLVAARKLRAPTPLLLAFGLGLVLTAALIEGIANGAGWSEAGHEARRVAYGIGGFILAWPILEDESARRRFYRVLLALGLTLGVWGLAQWILQLDLTQALDAGVRPGVERTSAGRGQLQGGLYAFPAAVILSFAALVSHRIRSQEARWLLGAIFVSNVVSLGLTFERAFWMVAVLGCLLVALRSGPQARRAALRWGPIAAVVLLVALTALGQLRTAAERLSSVTRYGSDDSLSHREVEAQHVMQAIAERPLTGAGFGAMITWGKEDVFQTITTPFAHNGYLWLAWKIGIPAALLAVLLILATVMRRGPPSDDPQLETLRIACQATLLGLLAVCMAWPIFNTLGLTAAMGVMLAVCLAPRAGV
jgi:O-antigen ligase/polysaccharide polymerase Wzy-like membrane protein